MAEAYAALDVSDKSSHVCVVDGSGAIIWSGACATDPDVIAKALKTRAPELVRVVLETGPLSAFLYHGLMERGVPVICVCARHAKGVLSARVNKSDPHDAEGLAQMSRTGWFKAVRIKQEATHIDRARLKIREQLVASHRVMSGQLRGLLKLFGLRMGKVSTANKRRERLEALFARKPELKGVMAPLIESLEAIEVQIARSTKRLAAQAAADPVTVRLMTAPGVGPITALIFKSSIEDPDRFERGEDAGAFAGLAPRRSQSGERDHRGHISKAGDPMLRAALYEAANCLLGRVKRPCALQAWGKRLAETKGSKRARVAVARKLAILLHRLWQSQTEFRWA
jgi:transposase